jgi:hypothetical protein
VGSPGTQPSPAHPARLVQVIDATSTGPGG